MEDKLIEMRLVLEGAIRLYEKKPNPSEDEYSLIGEALYLACEKASECLKTCQNDV